jgi:5-methylcytosine-specific restriction protein A
VSNNRKVICAGCLNSFYIPQTTFHRRKRWCGDNLCKEVIDEKVKHHNYKKTQKKIEKGTFRHGVNEELRNYIRNRDDLVCRLCNKEVETIRAQVHHIVPVSNGGEDDYTNLILLCHNCHVSVHQNGWDKYVDKFNKYTTEIVSQKI